MDILAARKKAAEKSAKKKKKDTKAESPKPDASETAVPEHGVGAPPVQSPPVQEESVSAGTHQEQATAGETETVRAPAEELEMLSFRAGNEEYVISVDTVREVLKNRIFTLVPNAPDYILGVMALRGVVLPVIDLAKRLGLPGRVSEEKVRIIVVTGQDEDAGIMVDRVIGVVKISPDSVRPVPETIESGGEFLKGIARKGEKLYILLDIEKVLGA